MLLIDANHHHISNDVYVCVYVTEFKKKINMIKFLSISFPGTMSAVWYLIYIYIKYKL